MATSTLPIRVTLLTQAQCAFCDDAKSILARLGAEYPLCVETIDLETAEGAALAMRGGMLFPPGMFLDEEPFSYGRLSERKLRRELEQRCCTRTGETR